MKEIIQDDNAIGRSVTFDRQFYFIRVLPKTNLQSKPAVSIRNPRSTDICGLTKNNYWIRIEYSDSCFKLQAGREWTTTPVIKLLVIVFASADSF